MTKAKQQHPARELDTRVRYLRLTGVDGAALVAAMSGRTAKFRALLTAKPCRLATRYKRRISLKVVYAAASSSKDSWPCR